MEAYYVNPFGPSKKTVKDIEREYNLSPAGKESARRLGLTIDAKGNIVGPAGKASGHRRRKYSGKRSKNMAKKRKSHKKHRSAAQKAATQKMLAAAKAARAGKPSRKKSHRRKSSHRKASRQKAHRRRHVVHAHRVHGYRRPKTGMEYFSNPSMKGLFGTAVSGLVAAGVLFGALFAVGWVNGQKNRVPALASGWGALLAKLALGIGGVIAASYISRKRWVSERNAAVIGAAAFAPLGLDLLGRIAPGLAAQVSLADEGGMSGITSPGLIAAEPAPAMDADLQAALEADLQGAEAEVSAY